MVVVLPARYWWKRIRGDASKAQSRVVSIASAFSYRLFLNEPDGFAHGLGHRHLPHPLTCLPPHLLPGQPQNLGGTPE